MDVDYPACVRQQWGNVQSSDAHGPEAMRKKREDDRRRRSEQVDREVTAVERQEIRRDEGMEQLIEPHHRCRDHCHHAFRAATPPSGIAYGNRQKSKEQCDAHEPRLSWRCLPVNRRQAETIWTPVCVPAIDGHS